MSIPAWIRLSAGKNISNFVQKEISMAHWSCIFSCNTIMNWIPYSNFFTRSYWNIPIKKKQRCMLSYETRRERRYYSNSNLIVVLHLTRQTRRPCLMGCVGARATEERGMNNCFCELWKREWLVGVRKWAKTEFPSISSTVGGAHSLFPRYILACSSTIIFFFFLNQIMFSLSFLHCVIAYSYFGYARKLTNNIEE